LDRRELIAGLGMAAVGAALPGAAAGEPIPGWVLRAKRDDRPLHPPGIDGLIWTRLASDTPVEDPGTPKPGGRAKFSLLNQLPVPIALNWHGLSDVPDPVRMGVPADDAQLFDVLFHQAGTYFCDLRLLGDGQGRPSRARAFVIQEREPVAVDRDEVLLIEDWRLRADGTAVAAGTDPTDAAPVLTVNGRLSPELACRVNERLRLRFINACQRAVIAIKIDQVEVRVMAIDGQPAEPFAARNGALVLAPGGRVDAFVDVTVQAGATLPIQVHDGKEARPVARLIVSNDPPIRVVPLPPASPLPSNGLPAQLDLKTAVRVDLALNGPEWSAPASFAAALSAFKIKRGRVVVLALANRAATATVFHLHGHHFRLLDRLDDGWKPFWLDTLAIEPGQTQRIAFAAERAGSWLMESTATDWAAPRRVRWYIIE
jgi:FtsP/CotA-like multicopper oxidase with cupredoxin domain